MFDKKIIHGEADPKEVEQLVQSRARSSDEQKCESTDDQLISYHDNGNYTMLQQFRAQILTDNICITPSKCETPQNYAERLQRGIDARKRKRANEKAARIKVPDELVGEFLALAHGQNSKSAIIAKFSELHPIVGKTAMGRLLAESSDFEKRISINSKKCYYVKQVLVEKYNIPAPDVCVTSKIKVSKSALNGKEKEATPVEKSSPVKKAKPSLALKNMFARIESNPELQVSEETKKRREAERVAQEAEKATREAEKIAFAKAEAEAKAKAKEEAARKNAELVAKRVADEKRRLREERRSTMALNQLRSAVHSEGKAKLSKLKASLKNGDPIFQLGREFFIESLGNLDKHYCTKRYLLPAGFKSRRKFCSFINPVAYVKKDGKKVMQDPNRVEYTSEIVVGLAGMPLYRVTASDAPDDPVESITSATACWDLVLDRISARREDPFYLSSIQKSSLPKKGTKISGPNFYGFALPQVREVLEGLPGALECTGYEFMAEEDRKSRARKRKGKAAVQNTLMATLSKKQKTSPKPDENQEVSLVTLVAQKPKSAKRNAKGKSKAKQKGKRKRK
jgi:hypothetical protein